MSLAETAGLLADRTRAAFCLALFDGRAWTAGELARHAGVSASTASEHLSRLVTGGLLVEERQGRHRYVRLSGPAAAQLIESLAAFTPDTATPAGLRESTRLGAEARARTCYDHLAGQLGVSVAAAALERGLVTEEAGLAVTEPGRRWFAELGIDLAALRKSGSRPLLRSCLDWTERRNHLAGAAGAALCSRALDRRWVERIGSGRALTVTAAGRVAFADLLGIDTAAT
ncbi:MULTISPECIES: helix-turn-helix transcriptional regulator [unclassified Kitasatospora]|uniref:ArsR/SmtB family transcription factor n=1 Tax=unclassified Kitasatospora TaxID=2633591 RepID=UPI00070E4D68|nr:MULTISPECIES: helix-turn-helix domain-containing protein [unclassified Kitasatospora]KQV09905.1 ArsR family transcriptional regulator [Kitasatospora sp. Root107]KRB70144.1 ArsR family transcriptional regulator [Kitasatospora sp. Root187]